MGFGDLVNRVDSLISLSSVSFFEYRNAIDYCALILYPATLLNSSITSNNLGMNSFGFSI